MDRYEVSKIVPLSASVEVILVPSTGHLVAMDVYKPAIRPTNMSRSETPSGPASILIMSMRAVLFDSELA